MGLLAWIKRLFRGVNIDNNNSLINKSKIMAKKTVITKVLDANAQDGIIEFPQNRTLYADQFTDVAPNTDEDREGFKAKSMKEVFEHYQPSKEGVALETEEGGAVYENFEFKQIKDFEDEQLIEQSNLLSSKKAKIDAYNSVIRQLEKNKTLRNTLKDDASKENLKNALRALLTELENAE
jgi:hypothetical protein